jgi:hypothetical protein
LSELLTVIVVCDIVICIQELAHTLKMFDAAGVAMSPCSHVTASGAPCGREHVKSLTQYSDLKKFKQLIGRVEAVVKGTKKAKAQFFGQQVLANLKFRIVPNTAPGVAKGTMMVNTK